MESDRTKKLISILKELKQSMSKKDVGKYQLDRCQRIIERLHSFSPNCKECDRLFTEFENHILSLRNQLDSLTKNDNQLHKQIEKMSSHLQNQHNLLTSGYYLSIYMSIGLSLGMVFGLLFLDNIAQGLPIGFGIGIVIGAYLDANAEKKGKTF